MSHDRSSPGIESQGHIGQGLESGINLSIDRYMYVFTVTSWAAR